MDELWLAAAVVGLLILRLGIPLTITLLVGYWLNRLDAKWEAEAHVRQASEAVTHNETLLEMYTAIEQPCWLTNDCPETVYHQCPAWLQPDLPCWLARYRTEGRLTSKCYRCPLFTARQPAAQRVRQGDNV